MLDDLGFYDTQIHNPASFMTPNFGALAKQGITLMRHHTYLVMSLATPPGQQLRC